MVSTHLKPTLVEGGQKETSSALRGENAETGLRVAPEERPFIPAD